MSVEQLVRAKEEELRRLRDEENCCVFDGQGRIVLEKQGEVDHIRFDAAEVMQIKAVSSAVFTHNHPSGWNYPPTHYRHKGRTFSLSDVVLAAGMQLAEMRAVGPVYRFSIKPPVTGWGNLIPGDIEAAYYASDIEVTRMLVAQVRAGLIELDEANYLADHARWLRVAELLGLQYEREEG